MDIIDFTVKIEHLAVMRPKADFLSTQVTGAEYYFLNISPPRNTPGTVVCGGVETCTADYRIERRRFRFHSIEFVAAGRGLLVTGGHRFALRPGTVFYYTPSIPHEIESDPEAPMLKYFVDFRGPRFEAPLRTHPLALHRLCFCKAPSDIQRIFDDLQRRGRAGGRRAKEFCACLLDLLILQLAEEAHPPEEGDSSPARHTYERCRTLIERRFLHLPSLEAAAAECHVSPAYMCRLFKRFAKEPPYRLLVRLKMRYAADRISRGDAILVKQVAREAGFEDPYHFSRAFKRVYGVSPEHFL